MKLAESTKASVFTKQRAHTELCNMTSQLSCSLLFLSFLYYLLHNVLKCLSKYGYGTQTGLKCVRVKSEALLGSKMWFETAYNN